MELVAPGTGQDVDDAAQGAAVLGVVAARLELDLLDEVILSSAECRDTLF